MGLMLDVLPVAPFGYIINICKETSNGPESQLKGCSSIIHFVLDSITFRKAPNILYCDISSFQPMEIYVDNEAKLTLHGLVQLWKVILSPDADPPVVRIMDCKYDMHSQTFFGFLFLMVDAF
ncbi:hypothetical protein CsSME_00038766 [Camellia sinensis var. sinensis]